MIYTHTHSTYKAHKKKNHSVTTQSEIGTKFEIHFEIYIQLETFVYIIIIIETRVAKREAEREGEKVNRLSREFSSTVPIPTDPICTQLCVILISP